VIDNSPCARLAPRLLANRHDNRRVVTSSCISGVINLHLYDFLSVACAAFRNGEVQLFTFPVGAAKPIFPFRGKQVRKVLWTRKAPACLLTVLYAYDKPRPCINIHHYAPPIIMLQQAQRRASCCSKPLRCTLRYTFSEGSMSSFKSIT